MDQIKLRLSEILGNIPENEDFDWAIYVKTEGEEVIMMSDQGIVNGLIEHLVSFDCEELH